MGQPVATLKSVMTETEFRAHLTEMNETPDPDEQAAHLLKIIAIQLNSIVVGMGGKSLELDVMIPWQKKPEPRRLTVEETIQLFKSNDRFRRKK